MTFRSAPKVRRVRLSTRMSAPRRDRLAKYAAASGLSERNLIETAVEKLLDRKNETELLLRRFDRVDAALDHGRRDVEFLSEAFGRYLEAWFAAHAPPNPDSARSAILAKAAEAYRQFLRHVLSEFGRGHRFGADAPEGKER